MDIAKKITQNDKTNTQPFFVVTHHQTKGRGRLGRTWSQLISSSSLDSTSPSNQNKISKKRSFSELYNSEQDFLPFTFALPLHSLQIPLEWVSIMVGIAVYDSFSTIKKFLKNKFNLHSQNGLLFLKWPNDILWKTNTGDYKKLAGILCEAQITSLDDISSYVYIGVGINFFTCPDISKAGSFFEEVFSQGSLNTLTSANRHQILQKFANILVKNLKKSLFKSYTKEELKKHALLRMFPLNTLLHLPKQSIIGRFQGLNTDGALQILLNSGINNTIYSSDSIELMKQSKNIVCIDFGNTRIHISAKNEFGEQYHIHLDYHDLKQSDQFKTLASLFTSSFILQIEMIYVSVNSVEKTKKSLFKINKIFQKYLAYKNIKETEITEKDIFKNTSITNTFDQNTLGADRALKCIFAYDKSKELDKNVLVVSFGTATTCEGFSPNGTMIENFVYPGLQMSFDALHHFTALIPKFDAKKITFTKKPEFWTQETYLNRGMILSIISSILLASQLHSPCQIFLTGGNAQQIKKILFEIVPPHLTHNLDIDIVDNIETKTLLKHYDTFK